MNILLSGLGLFSLALGIHLVIWKIHVPHYQTKALLLTFLGTCFLGIIFALLSPEEGLWAWVLPHGLFESIHVLLVFFSLFLAYVITYSALKVDSPSLVIIKIIAEAMPMGLTRQDLENRLTDDILILPRIKDLLRDNLVVANGERLQLTPQGRTLIKIVVSYRSLLKLGKGG